VLESLKHIDRSIFSAINDFNSPLADEFFWIVSEGWLFLPLLGFLAVHIYRVKKIKFFVAGIICIAFTVLFCDQSSNISKHYFGRYRPTHNIELKDKVHIVHDYHGGKYGFFSAHAANTFGTATFLFLCMGWLSKKYRWLLFLWPITVGYSRIYLGAHYPSDILVGFMVGALWGFVFYKLFEKLLQRLDAGYA